MSPVELRPPPPPNRQPLWLFWTRRYIGLVLMRTASAILGAGNWVYQRGGRRLSWVPAVATGIFNLGMGISPRARHVSMMRQPPHRES
jgi:hypothetical protein